MRPAPRLVVVLLAAAVVPPAAFAHAMKARVTATAEAIRVHVSFDGEDDLRGKVTVRLFDGDTQLGQAEPDKHGDCSFPRPKPGRYRVLAEDDGFGHRDERAFDVKDGVEETVAAPPERPRGAMIAVGLGVVAVLTLVGYWAAGRKNGSSATPDTPPPNHPDSNRGISV